MKRKNMNTLAITVAVAALLGGGFICKGIVSVSMAAEDEHGHDHEEKPATAHGGKADEAGHTEESSGEAGHEEKGHDEGALKLSPSGKVAFRIR